MKNNNEMKYKIRKLKNNERKIDKIYGIKS